MKAGRPRHVTDEQIASVRKQWKPGRSLRALAELAGMTEQYARMLIHGRYKHKQPNPSPK